MSVLFVVAVFLSATLLFLAQPLLGKHLLPSVGGAPSLWNTCLVCFQTLLLLGYLYAHALPRLLGVRWYLRFHVLLLLGVFGWLGLAAWQFETMGQPLRSAGGLATLETTLAKGREPTGALFQYLLTTMGLPFLLLSATAPLLQRWYALLRPTSDPYPLYAASNAGSLLGLLAYPFLLEPFLDLLGQELLWVGGAGLFTLCTLLLARAQPQSPQSSDTERMTKTPSTTSITSGTPGTSITRTWTEAFRWVFLALVPSGLLVSVTAYLTTDLTPVPLLWIVPLALYLLSFIFAFAKVSRTSQAPEPLGEPKSRNRKTIRWLALRYFPILVVLWSLVFLIGAARPLFLVAPLHLATFFVASWLLHAELAKTRPGPERLTEFYLWLSLGGVLGGMAVTLLAPLIFQHIGLAEYPLLLLLACWFLKAPTIAPLKATGSNPTKTKPNQLLKPSVFWRGVLRWSAPLSIGLLTFLAVQMVPWFMSESPFIQRTIMFGFPALLVLLMAEQQQAFTLAVALFLFAGSFAPASEGRVITTVRNFFGVLRVTEEERHQLTSLALRDPNVALASGTLTLQVGNGSPTTVVLGADATNTLNTLAEVLNQSSADVVASVVSVSDGSSASHRLQLLSKKTGLGQAIHLRAEWTGPGVHLQFESSSQPIQRRAFIHGTTLHGMQKEDQRDAEGRLLPLTYYHPKGPMGRLFRDQIKPLPAGLRVAVVGLGVGSLVYYARREDDWTFFEIDPDVERLACQSGLFGYWAERRCPNCQVILGDARVRLRDLSNLGASGEQKYDLIILDAFTSDAIPLHLLTREAMQLYVDRLAPCGRLAFHISNHHFDLAPAVARVAAAVDPALKTRHWWDPDGDSSGKYPSRWLLLARDDYDMVGSAPTPWTPNPVPDKTPLWTDRFANLWGVMRWNEE